MKSLGYRALVVVIAANAPLVLYACSALSNPTSLGGFRSWAAVTMTLSLAAHVGAAFALARWLRALGVERRAAPARDILRGFRGQLAVAVGATAALWWLSYQVSSAIGPRQPTRDELAPLSSYGWLGLALVLSLGSLTAFIVAFRETRLPRASVR